MQIVLVASVLVQLVAVVWSVVEWRRRQDWRIGVFTALLTVMAVYRVLAVRTPRGPDLPAEITNDVVALLTTTLSILAFVLVARLIRDRDRVIETLRAGEQRLHESEARLRRERDLSDSVINALPGVFYLYDREGRFLRWNRNFETVTGYSGAEMAESHPLDFFAGDEKRLVAERIEHVFRSGTGEVEAEFVGKSGRRTPYYFSGARAEIDGRPCLIGMGIDISARKRAEAALRQSEERLRLFIMQAPVAIAMFDRDMRYLSVSRRWLTNFKLGDADLAGRSHYEIFPEIPEAWKAAHRRGLGGEVVRAEEDRFERADGSVLWVRWEVHPWHAQDGSVGGIVIFTDDISIRKQAVAALRESEERLRLAVDAAHMGIFDWDVPHDRITWTRWHEELWGFEPGEFGGKYEEFARPVHPDDLPGINAEVARCIAARELFKREFRVVWPDGSVHWVFGTGEFEFGPDGSPVRMRGVVKEVTDRKRAEQALRESRERLALLSRQLITAQEVERRHLARELHDEIGQVLTAVHISLQHARGVCPPAAWPRLDEADDITDRAIQQVRSMSLNLRPAMLDDFGLVPALRWLVERQQRPECLIELNLRCCGLPLPPDLNNASYRVVQEALTNVRRHANARKVWVDVTHTPDQILIRVRDDGAGCDVHAVLERTDAGRSFGVSGMRERVELLGGRFTLESSPGRGTTVEVQFPVPVGDDDTDEPEPACDTPAGGEHP